MNPSPGAHTGPHPAEVRLALYAGGDSGLWERVRLARHLASCPACRAAVVSLRRSAAHLRETALRLPPGLDWNALAAEMRANIRLGITAGECVEVPRSVPAVNWRAAAAMASVTLVIVAGLWLSVPRPGLAPLAETGRGAVLEATSSGIGLKENGRAFTLLHHGHEAVVSVNVQGGVRARFVDEQTGQVTINNVYAQ